MSSKTFVRMAAFFMAGLVRFLQHNKPLKATESFCANSCKNQKLFLPVSLMGVGHLIDII